MLLGPEGKRKLKLRHMTNEELFKLYDNEIILRLRNVKNLSDTRAILTKFQTELGNFPPSPDLAKAFLAKYTDRKPRTLYRYAQMLRQFFKWYGEPLDVKIKIPKTLPPYTQQEAIEKLVKAIREKKTHKSTIVRDLLLLELALNTGMRRSELANLQVKDINADFLVVRDAKNHKDRIIPLVPTMVMRLQNFTKNMTPEQTVFGLKATAIGDKVAQFAKKAGVKEIHAHSLRHKFATDLVERGANVTNVQQLLGHENLNTTQVYLGVADKGLRDTIALLGKKPKTNMNGDETIKGWRYTVASDKGVEHVSVRDE
ncbi:Site-specific recombinase XerD [Dehalogenimonas alkenigignens]|uniref:Site-specific recombinase XerD n=1 Tax=Dehalogenimonas alkenigignens TaxID=1217799 RepID=A0A0W0GIC4_9CHLR|nr:tyrosine-type recombinase/integrase [Dehalogenimonas alkenigignens]KTB48320.1 Site-specific recombinase XerD [Dehalogenimonas alkenigignens]